MAHYIANTRDIEFNLFQVLALGPVLDSGAFGDLDAETAQTMLDEVARFAEGVVAESFADSDRNPPEFDPATHEITVPGPLAKTVQAVKDAEWWRIGLAENADGTPAPASLVWAIQEMIMCANPSAMFFYGLGPAMAHTLAEVGTEEQQRWACMSMDKGWAATKGLSLFYVPKFHFDSETLELGEHNGAFVTSVEHKVGIKSSPT